MTSLFSLSCTHCGAILELSADIEGFNCEYCGTRFFLEHNEKTVWIVPVLGDLAVVGKEVNRTAAEFAIKRLSKETAALRNRNEEIQDLLPDVETYQRLLNLQKAEEKNKPSDWILAPLFIGFSLMVVGLVMAIRGLNPERHYNATLVTLLCVSGLLVVSAPMIFMAARRKAPQDFDEQMKKGEFKLAKKGIRDLSIESIDKLHSLLSLELNDNLVKIARNEEELVVHLEKTRVT